MPRTWTGRRSRTSIEHFAGVLGLDGRTTRSILADIDGRECVLGLGEDGLFVAEYYEETGCWTRVLKARARKELDRAERREQLAERLPHRQGVLALR